jgi:hypothetical protein
MNNIHRVENPAPLVEPNNLIMKLEEIVKDTDPFENDNIKEIPKTNLKMTSIKGFTEKRKKLKIIKMKNHVMEELKNSINIFDPNELHLNHSLVLFVAQIVEDIFNKPLQGDIKREVVIDICKPFFDGKEDLVDMVLELVFDKVKKTTLYRRNKQRIKNIGSFFLELFLPAIQKNFTNKLKL